MGADGKDDVMARLANWAEECRDHYHRVKKAGDQATEAEKAEGRYSYEEALERLSRLLADGRYSRHRTR